MQEVNYFLSFCPTFRSEKDSPMYHIKLYSSPTTPSITRPVRRLEPQGHVEGRIGSVGILLIDHSSICWDFRGYASQNLWFINDLRKRESYRLIKLKSETGFQYSWDSVCKNCPQDSASFHPFALSAVWHLSQLPRDRVALAAPASYALLPVSHLSEVSAKVSSYLIGSGHIRSIAKSITMAGSP